MALKKISFLGKLEAKHVILIGAIIGVVIIVALVINLGIKPPPPPPPEGPKLVYEVVVGDVKFKLREVKDRGNVLKMSESWNTSLKEDKTTTERFIEITVEVTNVGKDNISGADWLIKEIIDSQGRKFYTSRELQYWAPRENQCSTLIKPGFTPTPCIQIYEVARVATGLQVKVEYKKGGSGLIDLGI